ncbi:hypothetical protein PROFUN_09296 [Planoprotostelium fungivorum]|uniref:Uncharacterized protein n=1 Tax=Planoprotostelium fungivorum TaxID=1890364 RepID=A0A2P6NH81_9EUKA|nr:hypothetical protein PROFUN_09296 [Planoprotostelium fungivorum]
MGSLCPSKYCDTFSPPRLSLRAASLSPQLSQNLLTNFNSDEFMMVRTIANLSNIVFRLFIKDIDPIAEKVLLLTRRGRDIRRKLQRLQTIVQ